MWWSQSVVSPLVSDFPESGYRPLSRNNRAEYSCSHRNGAVNLDRFLDRSTIHLTNRHNLFVPRNQIVNSNSKIGHISYITEKISIDTFSIGAGQLSRRTDRLLSRQQRLRSARIWKQSGLVLENNFENKGTHHVTSHNCQSWIWNRKSVGRYRTTILHCIGIAEPFAVDTSSTGHSHEFLPHRDFDKISHCQYKARHLPNLVGNKKQKLIKTSSISNCSKVQSLFQDRKRCLTSTFFSESRSKVDQVPGTSKPNCDNLQLTIFIGGVDKKIRTGIEANDQEKRGPDRHRLAQEQHCCPLRRHHWHHTRTQLLLFAGTLLEHLSNTMIMWLELSATESAHSLTQARKLLQNAQQLLQSCSWTIMKLVQAKSKALVIGDTLHNGRGLVCPP